MQGIIVQKRPVEFSGKKGELIKGFNLFILREKDLEVRRYFCSEEKLSKIGFRDEMLCNPFTDDTITTVNVEFDESSSGKITPVKITE
jgi:hypothetical protein